MYDQPQPVDENTGVTTRCGELMPGGRTRNPLLPRVVHPRARKQDDLSDLYLWSGQTVEVRMMRSTVSRGQPAARRVRQRPQRLTRRHRVCRRAGARTTVAPSPPHRLRPARATATAPAATTSATLGHGHEEPTPPHRSASPPGCADRRRGELAASPRPYSFRRLRHR